MLLARPGAKRWIEANLTPLVSLAIAALYLLVVRVFDGRPTIWEALLVPLLIASTVLRPGSIAGRLLESAPMRWLGRLSYSLYLWQQLFCWSQLSGPNATGSWPLLVAASFACASFSYYFVEQPALALREQLEARLLPRSNRPAHHSMVTVQL